MEAAQPCAFFLRLARPAEPLLKGSRFRVVGVRRQGLLQVVSRRRFVTAGEVDQSEIVVCRPRIGPVTQGSLQVFLGLIEAPLLVVKDRAVESRRPQTRSQRQ